MIAVFHATRQRKRRSLHSSANLSALPFCGSGDGYRGSISEGSYIGTVAGLLASTFHSPVRPIRQLKRSRKIGLPVSQREQRIVPPLILEHAGERKSWLKTPLRVHFNVSQIAALKELVGLHVPVRELDCLVSS